MPSCGHLDYPCCGCGPGLEQYNDSDICGGCGEPEPYCVCEEYDDADPGDMDGDHASGLASAGWGTDEDYLPGGCDEY